MARSAEIERHSVAHRHALATETHLCQKLLGSSAALKVVQCRVGIANHAVAESAQAKLSKCAVVQDLRRTSKGRKVAPNSTITTLLPRHSVLKHKPTLNIKTDPCSTDNAASITSKQQ